MFDGNFRRGVDKVLDPVGVALSRIGITANALTAAGIVCLLYTSDAADE